MELKDLEKLWNEKDNQDGSLNFNEKILLKQNFDNASSEFDKLLKLSVLGRNLALGYFIISSLFVSLVFKTPEIAFPGFIGSIGMLLSFVYHLSYTIKLKKLNHYTMPILDLQKAISEFRIKSVNTGKYDLMVVLFWASSLAPMVIQYYFHKNLYTYFDLTISNGVILVIVLLVLYVANKRMYKALYEDKLLKAEAELKEILDFKR